MSSAFTLDHMLTLVHISGGDSSTKVYEDTELLWTFRPEAVPDASTARTHGTSVTLCVCTVKLTTLHCTILHKTGEVVFASALDGWGFSLQQFARLWAKKLQAKPPQLRRMLWGEYAYSAKAKKVVKWTPASSGKPMFVTMILDPIWELYTAALTDKDTVRTSEMAAALKIDVPPREFKSNEQRGLLQSVIAVTYVYYYQYQGTRLVSFTTVRAHYSRTLVYAYEALLYACMLRCTNTEHLTQLLCCYYYMHTVMKRWLPVADAVLCMVTEQGVSPLAAQATRMGTLWPTAAADTSSSLASSLGDTGADVKSVYDAIAACDTSESAPVVLFVSKMVPVKRGDIVDANGKLWTPPDGHPGSQQHIDSTTDGNGGTADSVSSKNAADDRDALSFVAFARVFSGIITPHSKIHVLGPKYHPLKQGQSRHITAFPQSDDTSTRGSLALYMMMGTGLHPVKNVPAGNVLAVAGLEGYVQKCATLSTSIACPALTAITLQAKPMVRVAVEALQQKDMQALELGLSKLYQADPAVEVSVTDRGEHIVCCLGELHLEQCLKDLREQYAGVEVRVSPPQVSFRESILSPDVINDGRSSVVLKPGQLTTTPWSEEEGIQLANYRTGSVRVVTASGECAVQFKCSPLPDAVSELLDNSPDAVRALSQQLAAERLAKLRVLTSSQTTASTSSSPLPPTASKSFETSPVTASSSSNGDNRTTAAAATVADNSALVASLRKALVAAMKEQPDELIRAGVTAAATTEPSDSDWDSVLQRVLAFGPRNVGANMLAVAPDMTVTVAYDGKGFVETAVPHIDGGTDSDAQQQQQQQQEEREGLVVLHADDVLSAKTWRLLENSLITGFQVACNQGPLAAEEMYGVLFQRLASAAN
eukprot:19465-Heterococcus_DN1.PRE.1